MVEKKTKSKKTKIEETKDIAKKETKKENNKVAIEEKNKKTETTKKVEDKNTKEEVKKKKFIQKTKKENKEKSKDAKQAQEELKQKKKLPTFRGRFGKKNIRKKSKAKWDKWRKPRGIDLDKGLENGYRPKIGYKNKTQIRGIHPSGFIEVRVENINQLKNIDSKKEAIKIGSTVGKRKRNEIIKQANEKKIWVLN